MSRTARLTLALAAAALSAFAQDTPTNDAPNPYNSLEGWAKLPEGRKWGSTSAVDIDRDGKSVWVAERCGANSCLDRATGQFKDIPVIIKFDENGNVIKMFGAGMFSALHGIYVDRQNNIWVTDYQDNAPPPPGRGGRGAAPAESTGPIGPRPGSTK